MTEKVTYIAVDGKQFAEDTECMAYEAGLLAGKLNMYDSEGKRVESTIDVWDTGVVYYISVAGQNGKKQLQYIMDVSYGIREIRQMLEQCSYPLTMMYVQEEDRWVDYTRKLNEMQDNLNIAVNLYDRIQKDWNA